MVTLGAEPATELSGLVAMVEVQPTLRFTVTAFAPLWLGSGRLRQSLLSASFVGTVVPPLPLALIDTIGIGPRILGGVHLPAVDALAAVDVAHSRVPTLTGITLIVLRVQK